MNDTFMKERPIFPLLVSMALPMVLSMTVNALYNIVDSFFVAQISEQAMTALSLVYPVQNMINAIAIGFGVGINALIALYSGAGDRCRADTAATHGLVFSILHGLIAAVVCIAMMPGFLRLFTGDEAVIALGVRYSSIAFFFAPVIMAELCFEKLFTRSIYSYHSFVLYSISVLRIYSRATSDSFVLASSAARPCFTSFSKITACRFASFSAAFAVIPAGGCHVLERVRCFPSALWLKNTRNWYTVVSSLFVRFVIFMLFS